MAQINVGDDLAPFALVSTLPGCRPRPMMPWAEESSR
jgi:hypothetical protein